MDKLAVMLLTVPLCFPTMAGLDFGMPNYMQSIWFETIVLVSLQIGFVAPPLGMLIFVIQGVAPPGTSYWDICRAVMP
jgi:TRAP-type C4-dicarboxylate transport system permease large subunit